MTSMIAGGLLIWYSPPMSSKRLTIPKLIAHRGAMHYAPENTLSALRLAHKMGAMFVEFDVMLTRDGVPVIFHDDTLDRTTNGSGRVREQTYATIASLDAGSWFNPSTQSSSPRIAGFNPRFAGERVPTLDEWLQVCAELKMGINIEIKTKGGRDAYMLADHVLVSLARYWHSGLPAPLVSSASKTALKAMYSRDPSIMLGYISDFWSWRLLSTLEKYHCVSFHVYHKRVTKARVSRVKATGRKVLSYTVNDKTLGEKLFAMGVDALFTNKPDLLAD